MKEFFTIIAVLLAVFGNIPYLRDVSRGKVRPHPYTWGVWSLVSLVTFFGQIAKGAGVGAIATGASEIFTIIIFIFSIRFGFKEIKKTDTFFLIVCLLGIIPWILTSDPTISVITVVTIDVIAFIPTLQKTWRHSDTENPILFISNVLRHLLTLFLVQNFNIATTLHSFAMIVTNSLMTLFILKSKKPKLK